MLANLWPSLKPLITDLGASYKSATKNFCIIQSSNKISRPVASLLHKILTGLFLMTYAPGLPCLLRDKILRCLISRARAGVQTPKFSTFSTIIKTSTEYEAHETEIRLSLD